MKNAFNIKAVCGFSYVRVAALFQTLLLLLGVSLFARAAEPEGRVFHVVYADYRPYSWLQDGQAQGLEVDIINALLRDRLHLVVEHEVLPWERAQQYVRSGRADALIATVSPERLEYAWQSSVPVTYWELSAFARASDKRFQGGVGDVDALKSFMLGTERGNRWVAMHLSGANVQYTESINQLPLLLIANRIDLIADDGMVIRALLANFPDANQIVEYTVPGTRTPMYFMLSKQSRFETLRPRIDGALSEMSRDGTLTRLHQHYVGNDNGDERRKSNMVMPK